MLTVTHPLGMNMRRDTVADLHQVLNALDHPILAAEIEKKRFGASTTKAIRAFQREHGLDVTGKVDEQTALALNEAYRNLAAEEPTRDSQLRKETPGPSTSPPGEEPGSTKPAFSVSGIIVRDDKTPVEGVKIEVIDKGLRCEKSLGTVESDTIGCFMLGFERDDLRDPERGAPNLELRVCDQDGNPLAESQQCFNARSAERFLIQVVDQPELDRLDSRLAQVLDGNRLEDLDDQELEFLKKTAQLPKARIRTRQKAGRLAAETRLPAWFHYGLLRQGLPEDLERLLDEPDERLRKALDAATASQTRIIPSPAAGEVDRAFARIAQLRAERLMRKPLPGRRIKPAELLEAAAIERALQVKLGCAMTGKALGRCASWREAGAESGLDPRAVQRIDFAFEAARLVDDHAAMLKALVEQQAADGNAFSIRELAKRYAVADWESLVERSISREGSDLPQDLTGKTVQERRRHFARRIHDRVAAAYPTLAFARGLQCCPEPMVNSDPAIPLLETILEQDADFDLRKTALKPYLKAKTAELALDTDAKLGAATTQMQRIQRVYRLDADPARASRLLAANLDSAAAIAAKGRDGFLAEFGKENALGEKAAQTVYDQAIARVAENTAILIGLRQELLSQNLPSIAPPANVDNPDYETLFGSLDSCAVEPCTSVLSPAAYLADLLAFINNTANIEGTPNTISGLDALTMRYVLEGENPGHLKKAKPEQDRRPDIPAIKLSCPNADTPLPYVDLVMEILEKAASGSLDGHKYQTEWDADQLSALPEYFIEQAYINLAAAVFPLTLPFDIWHVEAELLLPELGTNRVELLETFQPLAGIEADTTNSVRLGPSLTLPFHIRQDKSERGLPETSSLMRSERWARARLGLSGPQWELITGENADSQSPLAWGYSDSADDTWQTVSDELSNAEVFLERSGLRYEELMQLAVLRSVNRYGDLHLDPGSPPVCDPAQINVEGLDQAMAIFLHRLLRLRATLGWSLIGLDQAVMALDSEARAGNQPVLDAQFLINLAQVVDLKDQFRLPLPELLSWWSNIDTADYSVEGLPVYRTFYDTLVPASYQIELDDDELRIDFADLIAPVLGLTQSELKLLEVGLALGDGSLNLANLSTLYRHASLARALGLGIAEYLLAKQLIGFDPFTDDGAVAPTYQTLRFLPRFRDMERSGFSLDELHYLVGAGEHPSGTSLAPTEDWLAQTAESLRQTLSGIEPPSEDEDAVLDLQALAALRAKAVGIALAELLGIGTDVCRTLLTHTRLKADSAPPACCNWAFRPAGNTIMQALLAALGASEPVPHQDTVESILLRLHQAALLVSRLGLTAADLEGLVAIRGRTDWLNPTALPIDSARNGPQPLGSLNGLMHLVDFSGLRRLLPAHQRDRLFDLFRTPSQDYAGDLAELTGWPEDQIMALIGDPDANNDIDMQGLLHPDFPEHFRDARLALRIGAAIRLSQRLGLSVAEAAALLPNPETDNQAEAHQLSATRIRNALRARWGTGWNTAVKPLRDRLREQQRAALVAYLMHQWSLKRADDLFDLFLIDVEMSPCMQTSRIVQATASVQLFVQRVIMNLEPGLSITSDGAAQWEWMKNYRVWEGNRQVFLYPENWIQPELRDDKTPFFEELETELLQSDLTEASAETALLHYLEKLHEIARLQPCGMYREEDSGILHVFSRTRDTPHQYYWRQREDDVWTAWQRVDLDIEGDHLIPIVYNRRMYLLWPIFTEKEDAPFSQLEQDVIKLFSTSFKLQKEISVLLQNVANLWEQVYDLINNVGQNIITGAGEQVQASLNDLRDHFNNILGGLWDNLDSFNDRFNDITLSFATSLPSFNNSLIPIPEDFTNLFGNIKDLIDGMTISTLQLPGTPTNHVFHASNAFSDNRKPEELKIETPNNPVDTTNLTVTTREATLIDFTEITNTIGRIGGIVAEFTETQFNSFLPAKRLEVQLAWSEYKNDRWAAKKTTTGKVAFRDVVGMLLQSLPELPIAGKPESKRLFTFKGEVLEGNQLLIHCRVALPELDNNHNLTSWPNVPRDIGYFRMNSCEGRLAAIDTQDELSIKDIATDVFLRMFQSLTTIPDAVSGLFEPNKGQMVIGEPITPDDDPFRPSLLRTELENKHLLPEHRIDGKEDIYRIQSLHQYRPNEGHTFVPPEQKTELLYHDAIRVFFCEFPHPTDTRIDKYRMRPFYHPYTCALLGNIHRFGVRGLYDTRLKRNNSGRIEEAPSSGQPLQLLLRDRESLTKEYCFPYELILSEVQSASELIGQGKNLVVVALVDGALYIRIFDANEEKDDKQEDDLIQGEVLESLKNRLNPIPDIANLSPADRRKILYEAASVTGVESVCSKLVDPDPVEDIDFSLDGAYSQYNWEIFFHIPFLIATRLFTLQRFDQAQRWFHYIFNPTDISNFEAPGKYWRVKPFNDRVNKLLQTLIDEASVEGNQELESEVAEWRSNAFNPYLVARTRITAFQKTVVMHYLDNLIAWGDSLFRRQTREAINEATQLYVLAAKLLGLRPRQIPNTAKRTPMSFDVLLGDDHSGLDAFSNALAKIEINRIGERPESETNAYTNPSTVHGASRLKGHGFAAAPPVTAAAGLLRSLANQIWSKVSNDSEESNGLKAPYFRAPANEKLNGYWDLVEDRLFKIRHCMTLEGRALALPLLSAPINPELLVQARAMGIGYDTILGDLAVAAPHYRFQVMMQKATELCAEVKSLGGALLSALEKRDAEGLAVLRNTQERDLLMAIEGLKEKQIEESNRALEGIQRSKESAQIRGNHYNRLKAEFMSPMEFAAVGLNTASLYFQLGQFVTTLGSAASSLIPNFKGGFVTTLGGTFGGQNVGDAMSRFGQALGLTSSMLSSASGMVSTMGGYFRRADDWGLQIDLAEKEIEGLEQQIAAAETRVAIAEQDLENHKTQIENSRKTLAYMQDKFTNEALYEWMVSQLAALYFQSYQLAYQVAMRCQLAYARELGMEVPPAIIKADHWDGLKKGLLAGERLQHGLKRLDLEYLSANRREHELTKQISLARLNPIALFQLKQAGECEFALPEVLFDLDVQGHYMRRIRSVAISLPAVTGPFTGVHCSLELQASKIRRTPEIQGKGYDDELNYETVPYGMDCIVTSSGQHDSGLFETNLRDERYLPFEGAGAISTWKLSLPQDWRQFDYGSITDVILHLRYTARSDGALGNAAKKALKQRFSAPLGDSIQYELVQAFGLKHQFANEWHRKMHRDDQPETFREMEIGLSQDLFPLLFQGRNIKIHRIEMLVDHGGAQAGDLAIEVALPDGNLAKTLSLENVSDDTLERFASSNEPVAMGNWMLKLSGQGLKTINNMILLCYFKIAA